jgi:hypothetical protein
MCESISYSHASCSNDVSHQASITLFFALQEIVVRIEYKYSPNLTIIDTPGLISAAPGKKNTALQQAAKAVETMVTQKMMQQVWFQYPVGSCVAFLLRDSAAR